MEQDRYTNNSKLYILGIISLILALSLFFFSLYIFPFLVWNLHYDVPDFISRMIMYFEDAYFYSTSTSKMLTWMIFFVPSLIAGYISYYISNYIDDQILGLVKKPPPEEAAEANLELQNDVKESLGLAAKIIILMILILVIIYLLQVFVQSTS
ncbi:hypothetical protein [uncultured Legionella sp.]|uniref:hypothetical protein n=1 Tax=uncultured Legionella sp. TaxID=210934 RepID=UPI0026073239|nr:hypothetical protein [uncultured Legionella sp.]